MKINDILLEKKQAILKKWFDRVMETYPQNTVGFMKGKENSLHHPVGQAIYEGLEGLFDEIVGETDRDKVNIYLDNVIRIRAIQDFTPSQAVSFMFLLKNVVREELKEEIRQHQMYEDIMRLESEIDDLINVSFDIFVKCREKIYELKANEMKNWTYRALQRTKMMKEVQAED
jgi:hypothetical protein